MDSVYLVFSHPLSVGIIFYSFFHLSSAELDQATRDSNKYILEIAALESKFKILFDMLWIISSNDKILDVV